MKYILWDFLYFVMYMVLIGYMALAMPVALQQVMGPHYIPTGLYLMYVQFYNMSGCYLINIHYHFAQVKIIYIFCFNVGKMYNFIPLKIFRFLKFFRYRIFSGLKSYSTMEVRNLKQCSLRQRKRIFEVYKPTVWKIFLYSSSYPENFFL